MAILQKKVYIRRIVKRVVIGVLIVTFLLLLLRVIPAPHQTVLKEVILPH